MRARLPTATPRTHTLIVSDERRSSAARLFYLIGASGSGKDTLIDYCRSRLRPDDDVRIARRYITRPDGAGSEAHVALTEAEFERRRNAGEFALHWAANGLHYGIGAEINDWLDDGTHVLVNGSRAHVPEALARYGSRLIPVEVRVAPEALRARLIERGREDLDTIDARLQRSQHLDAGADGRTPAAIIDNNDSIAAAGERLLALLTTPRQPKIC